jgi:hypothetical protein
LKGEIRSTLLWEKDLAPLTELSTWNLTWDSATDCYTIAQADEGMWIRYLRLELSDRWPRQTSLVFRMLGWNCIMYRVESSVTSICVTSHRTTSKTSPLMTLIATPSTVFAMICICTQKLESRPHSPATSGRQFFGHALEDIEVEMTCMVQLSLATLIAELSAWQERSSGRKMRSEPGLAEGSKSLVYWYLLLLYTFFICVRALQLYNRDVQSWAPTPNAYAHDPPCPYITSRFVLEWMYYIINDNRLHLTLSANTYHTQWPVFEHHASNTFTHISCLWFYVLCFSQKQPSKRQQHSCTVTYLAFLLFNKLIIYNYRSDIWTRR